MRHSVFVVSFSCTMDRGRNVSSLQIRSFCFVESLQMYSCKWNSESYMKNNWLWVLDIPFFFCPGLHPDPVQAVSTIQTRMWAPNTMTWSLQKAQTWLRNPQKSLTHRCSAATSFIPHPLSSLSCLHTVAGVSFVCVCVCTLSSLWIQPEFSLALSAEPHILSVSVFLYKSSGSKFYVVAAGNPNTEQEINVSAQWQFLVLSTMSLSKCPPELQAVQPLLVLYKPLKRNALQPQFHSTSNFPFISSGLFKLAWKPSTIFNVSSWT